MHELSLATALVEQVQRVCEAEQASAVAWIRLRLGALAGVDRESFEFCFPLAAEGTCAAEAKLEFATVPAEILCAACGRRSTPGRMFLTCGLCGSNRVRVTAGREFQIVSVEVRMEEKPARISDC
jgi:hydrogenase nickel incorporation protein HypA/HybF